MTQPSLNQSVCGRVIVQTLSLNHNLRILLKRVLKGSGWIIIIVGGQMRNLSDWLVNFLMPQIFHQLLISCYQITPQE